MDDLKLVNALKLGDKNAFQIIFERYYCKVLAYVFTLSNDNNLAEEIAQQTFVTLWENKEKLSTLKSPKNYIFTIAYNHFIDHLRLLKKHNKLAEELKHKALNEHVLSESDHDVHRIKMLKDVIDSLPERCKQILLMNKKEGIKYKDIAATLDISVKTVESQMRLAYQKIREAFKVVDEI